MKNKDTIAYIIKKYDNKCKKERYWTGRCTKDLGIELLKPYYKKGK